MCLGETEIDRESVKVAQVLLSAEKPPAGTDMEGGADEAGADSDAGAGAGDDGWDDTDEGW